MLRDNLAFLLRLYVRPRDAMAAIVDEGSVVLGALGVLGVSLLFQLGSFGPAFVGATARLLHPASTQGQITDEAGYVEEELGGEETPGPGGTAALALALVTTSVFSTFGKVVALAVLYVPAAIAIAGLLARRGSFGVALTRDYGSLAACTFFGWTAAQLPFAVVGLALPLASQASALGGWLPLLMWLGAALAFGALMVLAFDVALGLELPAGVATALLAPLALLAQGFLGFLASPFLLYFAWLYFRGELGDMQSALGARRRFRRHLETATVNPRDSDAHLQLGLIHMQRRQYHQAVARFERALEIDPDDCDAHFQLGRIARQQGEYADAIRCFEAVVSRDESHAHHEIWREVGATYLEAGDLAHARSSLERFAEKRAWDPEGLYLLGQVREASGDTEGAQDAFERCAESARTAPDYRRGELRRWRTLAEQRLSALRRH